ncbi:MAG: peptide deformylase [Candidatus Levybacteria bacterium CG10_big_fil_rev_8_21_14_0_10_35_13]|nr:MAG: peptide deformylase [Candidatus Levybacteria bacterium CG10_big_fil_rev_8_21_14_0_10_35_13]
MAIRKSRQTRFTIIQAGDPRLKSANKQISNFKSIKTQKLIKDLIQTMHKTDLVGIAASQIGENYMVFVTHPRNTKSRKLGKTDKSRVYINPKITFKSKNQNIIYEGCGSVADGAIFGPVQRSSEVEVQAIDEKGQKFSLRADGILARIIQHEYDHLDGMEFIQKVSDYSKIVVQKHYRKFIRNSPLQKKNSQITRIEYKSL